MTMTEEVNQSKDDYIPFGPEWENHLKTLPKVFIINMLREQCVKRQAATLTDKERKVPAFALFGLAMKLGPPSFDKFVAIADKVGATEYLVDYAKDWLNFGLETKGT